MVFTVWCKVIVYSCIYCMKNINVTQKEYHIKWWSCFDISVMCLSSHDVFMKQHDSWLPRLPLNVCELNVFLIWASYVMSCFTGVFTDLVMWCCFAAVLTSLWFYCVHLLSYYWWVLYSVNESKYCCVRYCVERLLMWSIWIERQACGSFKCNFGNQVMLLWRIHLAKTKNGSDINCRNDSLYIGLQKGMYNK